MHTKNPTAEELATAKMLVRESGLDAHDAIEVAMSGRAPAPATAEDDDPSRFVIDFEAAVRWLVDRGFTRATAETTCRSWSFRATSGLPGRETVPGGLPNAGDVIRAREAKPNPRGAPAPLPDATNSDRDQVANRVAAKAEAFEDADAFADRVAAGLRAGGGR